MEFWPFGKPARNERSVAKKLDRIRFLVTEAHAKEMQALAQLSDLITAVGASLDAALTSVETEVQTLQARIADHEAAKTEGKP